MRHRTFARLALACAALAAAGSAAEAGRHRAARASKPMPERECMARAMYFESDRTQADGMLAVGTVVANRLASGRYGETVCTVVGQYAQFAPGVLKRSMTETKVAERAREVADAVLAGERHPIAGDAMFFHTANVPFRQGDKRYVLISGGNAFYKWNRADEPAEERANVLSLARAVASAEADEAVGDRIVEAALAPKDEPKSATRSAPKLEIAELSTPAAPVATLQPSAVETFKRNAFATALAYREDEPEDEPKTPAADAALTAMASLKLKPGPRVVAPAAPVQASMVPVWPAPAASAPPPPEAPNPSLVARANALIAAAWAAFH